jgi:hypothetical protein
MTAIRKGVERIESLTEFSSLPTDFEKRPNAHAGRKLNIVLAKPLRHGDHRELACRVGAKTEHAQKAGHGCGVDDVATFAVRADVWKEGTDAMKDSHKV